MIHRGRAAFILSSAIGLATAWPGDAPAQGKPAFDSKVINERTPGHAVDVDVDIAGAKRLYLVVTDGGDGYSCDWADWALPRLVGDAGEKKLTELKWKSARTDWGQVRNGRNAGGGPLRIAGKAFADGIGTHANSVIEFDLPAGYKRFKARAGLDNGGTDQGGATSVRFLVYLDKLPAGVARGGGGSSTPQGGNDAADAVANLEVAEGLEATLFAAEPMLLSPTNIDVDARGRVWVCECVNYRRRNGQRPEGDRILILEDTDGDGVADKQKVYYQGRDVDSALGICVLGNRVIVSCSPNIFVFTDTDGDDKPDNKELLFTNTGNPQHDHSAHAFTFGPDGKLYWNFGNTGKRVHDKDGKPVRDIHGNVVLDNGKPYYGGMPFRCNMDGGEFEVLAHNFRNNYEVAVDAFGTLWQSDNDDDGNRGVRINFVMEHGNYGYLDEKTGAGWRSPRTGMHEEIPLRHWHLRDPGVVPNLLQTGAGSPTGICVYEGRLLPEVFWDQVIHCDAGPSVVRAYPAKPDGAGYRAEVVNILDGAQKDQWFRPSDVCVAPDGSLIVADWYDPGVGGHRMGDVQKGRIFRVAPPKTAYKIPEYDYATAAGAVEALKNPNLAVRYLAWTALNKMQNNAEAALAEVFENSKNQRHRARALWLLSKIEVCGEEYVARALTDANPDIRITGLRAARQLKLPLIPIVRRLAADRSPQIRRECLIALRHSQAAEAAGLWAELAARHDGRDRWYLEALGIAADKQWDAFLDAWLDRVGDDWNTPAGRDILWRSRATKTPSYLVKILADVNGSQDQLPRYLRAFDFLDGDQKQQALVELAFASHGGDADRAKFISTEAVRRIQGLDVKGNPQHAAALARLLDGARGTSQFVELVSKFSVADRYGELLALAQDKPDDQVGVEAMRALLAKRQLPLVRRGLADKDVQRATATARALGNSADGRVGNVLLEVMNDTRRQLELRRAAARGLAKTAPGARELIAMAKADRLDADLQQAVALELHLSGVPGIKAVAERLFPLPAARDEAKLPSIADLLKMRGDATRGKLVFEKTGTCAKCHVVDKQGKQIGPDLSAIGSKLSRQAAFESILYPSAGISHNYESYVLATESGNLLTGVVTSQTPQEVTLVPADGIPRKFSRSEIAELQKTKTSLMPADLQKLMTAQELVDVVEYLSTLRARP